jgi:hypothetical protein
MKTTAARSWIGERGDFSSQHWDVKGEFLLEREFLGWIFLGC